jgi:hypothetical protein
LHRPIFNRFLHHNYGSTLRYIEDAGGESIAVAGEQIFA